MASAWGRDSEISAANSVSNQCAACVGAELQEGEPLIKLEESR
jgi:hypothetical protein